MRPPMNMVPQQPTTTGSGIRIDTALLTSMTPEAQKNHLGEGMYHYINRKHPEQAAKITGMLLEMDNSEIINLVDSQQLLDAKIAEAVQVLQQHNTL